MTGAVFCVCGIERLGVLRYTAAVMVLSVQARASCRRIRVSCLCTETDLVNDATRDAKSECEIARAKRDHVSVKLPTPRSKLYLLSCPSPSLDLHLVSDAFRATVHLEGHISSMIQAAVRDTLAFRIFNNHVFIWLFDMHAAASQPWYPMSVTRSVNRVCFRQQCLFSLFCL